ncbi:hypothetical protein [Mycoplasma sp. Mirounga ES2805-ORL]|nr:hypothetical protein [Mycoplasma sp. Mirounga ES2805-ORL]QSF13972.1 hypothetical protein JXZ90_01640 [Mycoplasma sp. Mirounga ES2805-ORL]
MKTSLLKNACIEHNSIMIQFNEDNYPSLKFFVIEFVQNIFDSASLL